MTNAETPTVSVETLTEQLEAASAVLKAAEEKQLAEGPALFKAGNYDGLAALNAPVAKARADIDRITKRIAEATKESRWASFEKERAPVQSIVDGIIADKPTAPLASFKGRILIDDVEELQGDTTVQVRRAMVTLVPTFSKADLDAYEEMIAAEIDVAAWDAAGISDVTITAQGLDTDSLKVAISPTSSLNAAGKSMGTEGARAGGLEYNFNGTWLPSRAFLEAFEASGHAWVAKNEAGLERALRGDGNALSNKAKSAAKAAGIESRAIVKAE